MGFGGRGRGGSTLRQESNEGSKGKKESKPSEGKSSEDEIRKLVVKFLNLGAGQQHESEEGSASPEQNLRGDDPCAGVYE